MSLPLTIDEVLTTTRSVRRRLDLGRDVPAEVLQECLELALQAPTGALTQDWHFVVSNDRLQSRNPQAIGPLRALEHLVAGHRLTSRTTSSSNPDWHSNIRTFC
jgi:nitroreductase